LIHGIQVFVTILFLDVRCNVTDDLRKKTFDVLPLGLECPDLISYLLQFLFVETAK